MSIVQLPTATIQLLTCSQIITSVSSAVKELMENALDAGASNIDIKLENNGLEVIEVKDDGIGISKEDTSHMCLPSYTSKIISFDDLDDVGSYGFRGEALNALCQMSNVSITTRTISDNLAMTYSLNSNGQIVDVKPSHLGKGTIVTASNLFRNLPVRKQFVASGRRSVEELQRVKSIVKSLGVINPGLRVCLRHKGCVVWQKHSVSTLKQAALQAVGYSAATKLEELTESSDEVNVQLLVPKKECQNIAEFCQSSIDGIMVFINKRPVRDRKLEKVMLKYIRGYFTEQISAHKYPICLISITTAPKQVDANLEPNKTRVYLKEQDLVVGVVEGMLQLYYAIKPTCQESSPPPAVKSRDESMLNVDGDCSDMDRSFGDQTEVERPVKRPKLCTKLKTRRATEDKNSKPAALQALGHFGAHHGCLNESLDQHTGDEIWKMGTDVEDKSSGIGETERLVDNISVMNSNYRVEILSPLKMAPLVDKASTEPMAPLVDNASSSEPFSKEQEVCGSCPETNRFPGDSGFLSRINGFPEEDSLDNILKTEEWLKGLDTRSNAIVNGKGEEPHVEISETGITKESGNDGENLLRNGTIIVEKNITEKCEMEKENLWNEGRPWAAAAWSRGNIEGPSGNIMQGSHVLLPSARGKTSVAKAPDCDLSVQSASSQLGNKDHSAFTKFSKQARPKILQENPGIAFTKVAGLLVKRWNSLSKDERESYELLSALADEERRQERERRARQRPRTLEVKGLLRKMGSRNTVKAFPSNVVQPPRKQVLLHVSMDLVKQQSSRQVQDKLELCSDVTLVGQLRPSGIWVCRRAGEISLLRHWALKEVVLFHQLMGDHTLPLKRLDTSISIDESILGEQLWKVLLSLKKRYSVAEDTTTVTSAGIAKNGFRVELRQSGVEATTCSLTAVSSTIAFYSITELRQVLQLIQDQGDDESRLHIMRPPKVLNYLRNEAVRLCRQGPAKLDSEVVGNLLAYWRESLDHQQLCLHYKPILSPIHTIS